MDTFVYRVVVLYFHIVSYNYAFSNMDIAMYLAVVSNPCLVTNSTAFLNYGSSADEN